jgi:hypothetical protein
MKPAILLFLALSLLALQAIDARAADPRYPDWPCEQAKVPEVSLAAIWAGPSLDDASERWRGDPRVAELVARISARRTSMEEAKALLAQFVIGTPEERVAKGKILFAGLFERLNEQRHSVMDGLERVTRRLRQSAEKIRADTIALQAMQDAGSTDQARLEQLTQELQWEIRVYDERRQMVRFVCEVPVSIDQRLFALGRAVQELMEE